MRIIKAVEKYECESCRKVYNEKAECEHCEQSHTEAREWTYVKTVEKIDPYDIPDWPKSKKRVQNA